MTYRLEIRAGEGGTDAKEFIDELMDAYIRMFDRKG
jgi:protein subunit release factor A